MKRNKILSLFFALAAFSVLFTSCEDDAILPVLDLSGGEFVSAEFTNSGTGNLELAFENANVEAEKFEWTASDFGVKLPLKYTLEMSTTTDFANPFTLGTTSSTSLSFTEGELNDAVLALGLAPFEAGDVSMRVKTEVIGATVEVLYSASITRSITPYVTEFESLYMIGDAVKGWDLNLAVEVYGVGPNQYEVIAEFNNGGAFRFFEAADWGATSYNWTYFEGGTVDANFESAADGDTNLRFIGSTGYYRISFNLVTKTIEMESVAQPELFIVGAGASAAGWSWDTPVEFTWIQDGMWEVTTDFINDAFRFFTVRDDWGSGLNYPHYAGLEYEIDGKLEDAMDGDNNFRFNDAPGTYKIIINEIEKTIVMAEAGTAGPPLYLVGAATPGGWDWGGATVAEQREAGVYIAELALANDAFRFFSVENDWGSGTNFPYYVNEGYTIDANFEDALDGDNNFRFIGVPGNYKITLDTNNKTITLAGGSGDPLYMVGAGTPAAGWSWDTPVEMMQIEEGKWVATTDFANDAFRFFTVNNDWGSGRNHPYYVGEGFTIDANFEDALDGDNNFRFIGTPGSFTIILDENAKTITLQ